MFEAPDPAYASHHLKRRPSFAAPLIAAVLILGGAAALWLLYPNEARKIGNQALQTLGFQPMPSKDDTVFAGTYTRLKMTPLKREVADLPKVASALKALADGPCDKTAIFSLMNALLAENEKRPAANALLGFAGVCPNSEGELFAGANILFGMGRYDDALPPMNTLLERRPDVGQYYYTRAQTLQFMKRNDEAVDDFTNAIALFSNIKQVRADVFTEMATSQSALGRHCDAMTTVQSYVFIDPANRDDAAMRKLIASYAAKGSCANTHAQGVEVIKRVRPDVFITAVTLNGTTGNFVIDTGASVVTIDEAFARKAKLSADGARKVKVHTANGAVNAAMVTASSIKLSNISADNVTVAILEKPIGDGIDGLLGMSFLARFDVKLSEREMRIQKRADAVK